MAIAISCIGKSTVSKQAVAKRGTKEMADFFKRVLATFTARALTDTSHALQSMCGAFTRVLIQDSTCVSLPPQLRHRYPGGKNNKGEPVATLKIQTVLELKTEQFIHMEHALRA
jgi:hypothetical protein